MMNLLRPLALTIALALLLPFAVLAQDTTTQPGPGREIEIGATVLGTLTPQSQTVVYHFIAEAGDVVAITMESRDVDAYLRLGDERGNELLSDDDSASDLNARIGPVRLPENGAYVIVASTFDNIVSDGTEVEVGDFTLTVTAYEPEEISYPVEIKDTLEDGEVLRLYSFEATAGDVLSISLNSDDFDPLLVVHEAGTVNAPSVRDDDSGPGRNALIVPYIVPTTGTYFLRATSFDEEIGGDYSLVITPLEAESLSYGDSVEITIARDQTPAGVFSFEAAEGDTVDIVVESPTELDTTLTLLGPDGARVAFNDDTTGRNPALIAQTLPEDGTYTFVVQPFARGASGEVRVHLALSAGE